MNLVSVTRTFAAGAIPDPLVLAVEHAASERFLWMRPDEGWSFVGLGMAAHCKATGPNRVAELAAFRAEMASTIAVAEGAPSPRLVGGASFDWAQGASRGADGELADGPSWAAFGEGLLIVPELLIEHRADVCTVTAVAATADEADARIEGVASAAAWRSRDRSGVSDTHDPPVFPHLADDHGYVDLVERGVKAIKNDEFEKVVLARDVRVEAPADLAATLHSLVQRFPSCAVFAFTLGEATFFGATPERLVALADRRVTTMALAGSIGRGADADEDEQLALQMLGDAKELAEHDFVVDAIGRRLASLGVAVDEPGEPQVVRLAQVQHLRTELTGRIGASDGLDVLRLTSALHPTPAVAGSPRGLALDWIRSNEPLDRGWYAGPIGWCDLDGEGDIRVALRSALVSSGGCAVFAGAGIVAASDAERELTETALKLRAVVDSLYPQ